MSRRGAEEYPEPAGAIRPWGGAVMTQEEGEEGGVGKQHHCRKANGIALKVVAAKPREQNAGPGADLGILRHVAGISAVDALEVIPNVPERPLLVEE